MGSPEFVPFNQKVMQLKEDEKRSSSFKNEKDIRTNNIQELATLKRPKKYFSNHQEREEFVKHYQAKIKTEMCKNWEVLGRCFYQNTCSFAHGEHELMKKEHLQSNFKSRPCVVFHRTAFCPYGSRCVFSHL